MDVKKEEGTKISFNLSPSSLNIYYKSPLLFYLTYIAKAPDDTQVPLCYSLSGNIVHDCLERYANKELKKDEVLLYLLKEWKKKKLNFHADIRGNLLNQSDYLTALIKGMQIIDGHDNHLCEETISIPFKENEIMNIKIKGIIDLQAMEKGSNKRVIVDYKTSNNVDRGEDFLRQALFYNLLLYKKKNAIPEKTSFYYLKLGIVKEYSFTARNIEDFQQELDMITNQLLSWGTTIENYPIGDIEGLFNSKKRACLKEIERRRMLEQTSKPISEFNL